MAFFIKRASSSASVSGPNKTGRRITKDDISRPTLLPWGGPYSLPANSSTLKDAMKGHKRGKSEPFPARRSGWSSLIGGRLSRGFTKIVLSASPSAKETPSSVFPEKTGAQSIQIILPIYNKDKSLPATPQSERRLSFLNNDLPQTLSTNASPRQTRRLNADELMRARGIIMGSVGCIFGEDVAADIAQQHKEKKEREAAEDDYGAISLFSADPMYGHTNLEPAFDDESMTRPISIYTTSTMAPPPARNSLNLEPARNRARASVCTTKTWITYKLIIQDDPNTIHENIGAEGSEEPEGIAYVPAEGTLLARLSKDLSHAKIPHTIMMTQEEGVIPSHHSPEADDAFKFETADTETDLELDPEVVLQFLREGMDDVEEEFEAKEIIFSRGSEYVYRREMPERSEEETRKLREHRKGTLISYPLPFEDEVAMFGFELPEGPDAEACYDSDEDGVPSEY